MHARTKRDLLRRNIQVRRENFAQPAVRDVKPIGMFWNYKSSAAFTFFMR